MSTGQRQHTEDSIAVMDAPAQTTGQISRTVERVVIIGLPSQAGVALTATQPPITAICQCRRAA